MSLLNNLFFLSFFIEQKIETSIMIYIFGMDTYEDELYKSKIHGRTIGLQEL